MNEQKMFEIAIYFERFRIRNLEFFIAITFKA